MKKFFVGFSLLFLSLIFCPARSSAEEFFVSFVPGEVVTIPATVNHNSQLCSTHTGAWHCITCHVCHSTNGDFDRKPVCNCASQLQTAAEKTFTTKNPTATFIPTTRPYTHSCNNDWGVGAQQQTITCKRTYRVYTIPTKTCSHKITCSKHNLSAKAHDPAGYVTNSTWHSCSVCGGYTTVSCAPAADYTLGYPPVVPDDPDDPDDPDPVDTCSHTDGICSIHKSTVSAHPIDGYTATGTCHLCTTCNTTYYTGVSCSKTICTHANAVCANHSASFATHPIDGYIAKGTITTCPTCGVSYYSSVTCAKPTCTHIDEVCSIHNKKASEHPYGNYSLSSAIYHYCSECTQSYYTNVTCTCMGQPESQDSACVFKNADLPYPLDPPALTCEITPDKDNNTTDLEKFYNINDSFILSGNHHGECSINSYTEVHGAVTCTNNPVNFLCSLRSCTDPTCNSSAHNYSGACNKTSTGITGYTDILYETIYHDVQVNFVGFTVNGVSTLTINPDVRTYIGSDSPVDDYQSNILKITGINYSGLVQDTSGKSYGKVIVKCPTCNNEIEFNIYFAFTPEVLNGNFSRALRATLISDLRYKDYFLNDGEPYSLADPKAVLIDNSKRAKASTYSEVLKTGYIKTGYAVNFALNTMNTPIEAVSSSETLHMEMHATFLDKYGIAIDPTKIYDSLTHKSLDNSDYDLFIDFSSVTAKDKFKITSEESDENEILWKWLYYMPPMLTFDDPTVLEVGSDGEVLLTIKLDIRLKYGDTVLWDYIKILSSENVTNWTGKVFKYNLKESALDDFDNTISD